MKCYIIALLAVVAATGVILFLARCAYRVSHPPGDYDRRRTPR